MKKAINDRDEQSNKDEKFNIEDEYLLYRASEAMFNKDMELFNSLSDDGTEIPGLGEFDKRMHDKIDNMYKHGKRQRRKKLIYRTAGIAAVVFISLIFIPLMAGRADAFFAEMMKLIMKDEGTYTEFILEPEENQHIEEFKGYYYPKHVPEDYEIIIKNNMDSIGTIIYSKESDSSRITYTFSLLSSPQQLDTENCDKKEILINNQIGLLYTKKDGSRNMIIFHNNEYKFVVYGNIDVEILKKIAESIKR